MSRLRLQAALYWLDMSVYSRVSFCQRSPLHGGFLKMFSACVLIFQVKTVCLCLLPSRTIPSQDQTFDSSQNLGAAASVTAAQQRGLGGKIRIILTVFFTIFLRLTIQPFLGFQVSLVNRSVVVRNVTKCSETKRQDLFVLLFIGQWCL